MSSRHDLAARFQPLGLDELDASAGLARRLDRKYILGERTLQDLIADLASTHHVLEIEGRRIFSFITVYFDTSDLLTYRSHVQGRRRRFKCRTRHYLDAGYAASEVKLKGVRGQTVKRRLRETAPEPGKLSTAADCFVRQTVFEEYGLELVAPLHAILTTEFRRLTLVAIDRCERVTCDFDLTYTAHDGRSFGIQPQTVIVETKSLDGRTATDRFLVARRVRPVRVSKYVAGVSLTSRHAGSNEYRRLLRRHFQGEQQRTQWQDAEPASANVPPSSGTNCHA